VDNQAAKTRAEARFKRKTEQATDAAQAWAEYESPVPRRIRKDEASQGTAAGQRGRAGHGLIPNVFDPYLQSRE
jgi:hypothetical protein